ncbi:Ig-like domain-containing protein [Luteitalea sp. TBR-22]|uniref:Ig-like domain-containing protein n=1 Tax=Luteitalea sp. TBR-22 TaxID=2802971 RepID=UPI001AF9DEB2|nr:Ig-like domain-containing protein [Luteitalea sp. TBR-22]
MHGRFGMAGAAGSLCVALGVLAVGCGGSTETRTVSVTSPTPTTTTTTATVTAVRVTGPSEITTAGGTAQFTATVTLSTGATEDRTSSAQWSSENSAAATISNGGMVTAVADGSTNIVASFGAVRGSTGLMIRLPKRTADPPAGQRLPLPDVRAFIQQKNAERPELMAQSCPGGVKYRNNPWLDYIVDELRKVDTRWGYNAKPTRGPSDNGGLPVIAAGDEIAYHYGPGPDQGSPDVHLVDILAGHCGTPSLTWRVFTGEEPGIWTGVGRF